MSFEINKNEAKKNFKGSDRLFKACWSQYVRYLNGAIDNPSSQNDVDSWLETIAGEKVNNPKSTFYIHG